MSDPARKRASYADVRAAPADQVAEVIDGVLYTHARPTSRHARAATALAYELMGPFDRGRDGPGGWILLHEPEIHLGAEPDIVVPDLAGWRRTTLPQLPDVAYFEIPPDWVCEVLSPSTAARDRAQKMKVYQRDRVGHVWLVDPLQRTLEVFQLDGATYRLLDVHCGDIGVAAPPFHAVEVDLAGLWLADEPAEPR